VQTGVWFRRALDLARTLGDPLMLAHSLNRLANWQVNTGQVAEGLRLHEQALALFEAQGDQSGTAETLDLLGMANGLYGDILSAVQWYGRAIELYRALGIAPACHRPWRAAPRSPARPRNRSSVHAGRATTACATWTRRCA
jgi:tetratricopeptide (TPR) repeat protein